MSFLEFLGQAFEILWTTRGEVLENVRGHLVVSGIAIAIAVAIAVPVGAFVGHLHRGSFLAINLANTMRALPTLAIISLMLTFGVFGLPNIVVAMVILGLPLILTNTYVGVAEVDADAVEAARGMGMSGWQILWRIELPNAVRLIMAGIRTATIFIIATAYLASFAAKGNTLGAVFSNPTLPESQLFGYVLVSITLAFLADAVLAVVQRLLTPKGLKLAATSAAA